MSISPSGQLFFAHSGRQGSRTLISTRENRVSTAARPTVSGYLPKFVSCQWSVGRWREDDFSQLTTDHWQLTICSGRSRSRTDKITSLSSWPLFQFAYSAVNWQVQESHLAGEGYEPWLGTGPPAAKLDSELQAPESNRGDRPYESQLGASRACIEFRVTKGRVELPSPKGTTF